MDDDKVKGIGGGGQRGEVVPLHWAIMVGQFPMFGGA
jgi:hypothetical protein